MKKSIRFLVGALAALVACSAYATPIVTWQLDVVASFVQDNSTDPITPDPAGVYISSTQLKWGTSTGSGQSELNITNPPATNIDTNGAAEPNISLTHVNNPINGSTLNSVNILITVTLTPVVPPVSPPFPVVGPEEITFMVNFKETPNNPGTDVKCADGRVNFEGVNVNGCADIFVINQTAQDLQFPYPDPDEPTFFRTYLVNFFETTDGIVDLPNAACGAAGAPAPCIGLETQEEASTTIQFAARITTVPEPTTLLLMGLGLAGLGFARRLNG